MTNDHSKVKDLVEQTVKLWIKENKTQFFENNKELYRSKAVFDRCEKYIGAPDEYLKAMLSGMPRFTNWFLSVFETVFLVGLFGLIVGLLILSVSEVTTSFFELAWLIPLAIAIVSSVLSYRFRESLSHFAQVKFLIRHNINEIDIEMYYISTLLNMGNKRKENE